MHHITIRNATQLSRTFQHAREAGQEEQFAVRFASLLQWLTSFASGTPYEDVKEMVIEIRPDGDIPFSFYGVTQERTRDDKYRLRANAGLIRHNYGSQDVPKYQWSLHT